MILSFLRLPLYPVIYIAYVTGLTLESIVHLPTTISKITKRYFFLNSQGTYTDLKTYTRYTDYYINHSKYKDYIYVTKNNKLVKAYLMINKKTHKMSYVMDDISVCDDIDKYKITK